MGNSFVIDVPPSVNNLYSNRGKARVLNTRGRAYKEYTSWTAKAWAQENNWTYAGGQVAMGLDLIFPNKIRRDITNCIKISEDAVTEALGFDDTKCVEFIVRLIGYDKENPKAIFTLVNGSQARSCRYCVHFTLYNGEEFSDDENRYGSCWLTAPSHPKLEGVDFTVRENFGCNNFDLFAIPFKMEEI